MLEREFADSTAVSLEEILAEREDRAQRQKELLRQYKKTLLCITLNIPGAYKVFPLARRCFQEALRTVRLIFEAEKCSISREETRTDNPAGLSGFIVSDAYSEQVKELAHRIEETHPLGRLFDLDVFTAEGEKLSRPNPRRCFLCGGTAFVCARSRFHAVEDVQTAAVAMLKNFFRERLGEKILTAAFGALMDEAAVTPKPGLVDRGNNGAHRDMDFFSFINSSAVITPYFKDCALAGFDSDTEPSRLFDSLRSGGKAAEILMRRAAGGANTHKGSIFSFALVSAAYGRLYRKTDAPDLEDIYSFCQAMTRRISEDFSRPDSSHGAEVFARYGIAGARGEASAGFPSVRTYSYPVLRRMLEEGFTLNDAGIGAFLSLLARVDDTNIVHRSDPAELRRIQAETAEFLAEKPSGKALREKSAELDRRFIDRGISPGGCADLLGLTFFLHRLF
jgi:holo-ACP synthase/triphosphoribosyl-dephospho-CoA synthase